MVTDMHCKNAFLFLVTCSLLAADLRAQGIIIPSDRQPARVVLTDHRVDAQLEENLAAVSVEHVFRNEGRSVAEGTFLFPLPAGAQVTRFAMDVDGKEMAGKLLTADEARQIYEEIVRNSLDPALLEMIGQRSFRAGIFPIPPGEERTIRLRYDAELPREGNTISFIYPMHGSVHTRFAGWQPPRVEPVSDNSGPNAGSNRRRSGDEVSFRTSLRLEARSSAPILTVYSPSHDVAVERDGDRLVVMSYEGDLRPEMHDFVAYLGIGEGDVGATVLTHRPYTDRPGYFMLLVSPRVGDGSGRVQPKDVVFVLDTSGSMAGEKIDQAREALKFCLNRLGPYDRFGLVSFNSDVDRFRSDLLPASARRDALYFVDQLEAAGGTNIHDALLSAAEMLGGSARGMIIFLTDGLPSTGVTDEASIRRAATDALRGRSRVFSFGVGYDVNTRLLDGLSRETGAPANYVSPDENIEERVASFYEKVRHPLLTNLAFEIDGVDAYAFSPNELTDLYKGSQLLIAGRYRSPGDGRLRLTGERDGQRVTFEYDLYFDEEARDREFVGRLWATRRVGRLLDDIRMNGENDEIKEEIIALAKEYGLVTPYTSYLVREEEFMTADGGRDLDASLDQSARMHLDMMAAQSAFRSGAVSGESAVAASKAIQAMESVQTVSAPSARDVRVVSGRMMQRSSSGAWEDPEMPADARTIEIAMGSDAYFALLQAYPDVLEFAKLGSEVTFRLGEHYVRIGPGGIRTVSPDELRDMIGH